MPWTLPIKSKPILLGVATAAATLASVVLLLQKARRDSISDAIEFLRSQRVVGPNDAVTCLSDTGELFGPTRLFATKTAWKPRINSTESVRVEVVEQDHWNVVAGILAKENVRSEAIREVILIRYLDRGLKIVWIGDNSGRAWIWWHPER